MQKITQTRIRYVTQYTSDPGQFAKWMREAGEEVKFGDPFKYETFSYDIGWEDERKEFKWNGGIRYDLPDGYYPLHGEYSWDEYAAWHDKSSKVQYYLFGFIPITESMYYYDVSHMAHYTYSFKPIYMATFYVLPDGTKSGVKSSGWAANTVFSATQLDPEYNLPKSPYAGLQGVTLGVSMGGGRTPQFIGGDGRGHIGTSIPNQTKLQSVDVKSLATIVDAQQPLPKQLKDVCIANIPQGLELGNAIKEAKVSDITVVETPSGISNYVPEKSGSESAIFVAIPASDSSLTQEDQGDYRKRYEYREVTQRVSVPTSSFNSYQVTRNVVYIKYPESDKWIKTSPAALNRLKAQESDAEFIKVK